MSQQRKQQPRWLPGVAILAVGVLFLVLPKHLRVGPEWTVLITGVVLEIPVIFFHRTGRHKENQIAGYILLGVLTGFLLYSLVLLLRALVHKLLTPGELLISAAALWISNLLVFASWYWRLDAGGPHLRYAQGAHTDGAFLFPQMSLSPDARKSMGEENWSPGFIDYLFLAFNTSTAFSPTDVPVLSGWAKSLMMIQASISLITLALLAARAVNIL